MQMKIVSVNVPISTSTSLLLTKAAGKNLVGTKVVKSDLKTSKDLFFPRLSLNL